MFGVIELEARPLMTFKVLILVLYGVNTLVFILMCMNAMCT